MTNLVPRNIRIIHEDILRDNVRKIRFCLPKGTRLMAVVKADGYGHGAFTAARAALSGGAEMLAVASVDEGLRLRKAGIDAPILVLGAVTAADAREGVEAGLIQTVCSREMVRMCEEAGRDLGKKSEVHLKVDTGMGRIGVRRPEEVNDLVRAIAETSCVKLTGVFTHFSDADGDAEGEAFTEKQFRTFLSLTRNLPREVIRHCANSAAIHRHPEMAMDMVRCGISMYGYPPVSTDLELKPCMEWRCKVSYVKELPAGEYISYGRTFRTEQPTRIATITCGYADGYHRAAGEKAEVLIRGQRRKVVGRICMDQMMVDVTGDDGVQPGDPVILMGEDGRERITAEDLARWSGTISYEILLSVGSRVARITEGQKETEKASEGGQGR